MKNTLFIIACLSISAAVAQPEAKREKKTPEERAEIMTSRMKKNLNLTDEQVANVKAENLAFFQKQEAHRLELQAIHEKGKQLREREAKLSIPSISAIFCRISNILVTSGVLLWGSFDAIDRLARYNFSLKSRSSRC